MPQRESASSVTGMFRLKLGRQPMFAIPRSKSALLIALLLVFHPGVRARIQEPTVKAGDRALVAADSAELRLGSRLIAKLRKGQEVTVKSLRGKWAGCSVRIDDRERTGWILASALAQRPDEDQAAAPSGTSQPPARTGETTAHPNDPAPPGDATSDMPVTISWKTRPQTARIAQAPAILFSRHDGTRMLEAIARLELMISQDPRNPKKITPLSIFSHGLKLKGKSGELAGREWTKGVAELKQLRLFNLKGSGEVRVTLFEPSPDKKEAGKQISNPIELTMEMD